MTGQRVDPHFELAMRHSPVGMALVAPDGSFLVVNDALCSMLGRDEAELRAATWQELTLPEDVATDAALVTDVLEGRRDSYRVSKRYLRPDGAVVHGDLSVACVRDGAGAVSYFISQVQDVTELWLLSERHRIMAENVNDVVALGDNEGSIVWVLPSVTEVMGWDPAEMSGRRFRDFVHPEDLAAVAAVQDGVSRGEPGQFEARLQNKAGDYRWMNVRVRPVVDEHGVVVARVAGWWDAESTHAARLALSRSEERYRAALAAKIDAHVFLDAVRDDAGRIVDFVYADANAPALAFIGMAKDDLRATTLLTAFPGQEASGLFARYVRTVETGEPLVLDEFAVPSEVLDRDAKFDFRGVRVGDGVSLTWRDVTDRVSVRESLRESEQHFRLLAENASDVVFQTSSQGVIEWLSPAAAEVLGAPVVELLGRSVSSLVHPDDAALFTTPDRRADTPQRKTSRVRIGRPDGWRWTEVTSKPVHDADGSVVGRVGGLRDVHEQVLAEDALAASESQARDLATRYEAARDEALQANLAKTVFLSRMSHELRTPLNAILGFAQLLAMDELTDDQRESVVQIRSGGKHLLGLITEILDISRIESGRLSLSMESVSVVDAVDEALDLVRPLAAEAGISISRTTDGAPDLQVWADRQRMIQILLNLVSNAVKYNREGGSVVVSHESLGGGTVAVRVADTGPGLLPEQLANVFEPFDRLGAERTTIEGTGIGLTLSQGLARIMSGRLEASSVPGEGCVFSLVLPASNVAPGETEPYAGVIVGPANPQTRVLYIEDNPTNTHLMRRIAALRAEVELTAEATGSAGIAAARDRTPDLVFLDLHLPDIPGEAVLTQLLALPTMVGVPVVVVTADATPGLGHRLKSLGADAVLTKPVDVGEVLAWIDHPSARRV